MKNKVGATALMHNSVSGAPINFDSWGEKIIMRPVKTSPMVANTLKAVLNIRFALPLFPLATLFAIIIDIATGSPDVEITYKKA